MLHRGDAHRVVAHRAAPTAAPVGKVRTKRVHPPGGDSIPKLPPCSSAISRLICKPRPMPVPWPLGAAWLQRIKDAALLVRADADPVIGHGNGARGRVHRGHVDAERRQPGCT
ncbi:MAG: hypothetical protein QOF51_257 [Chloroflexota bacterium]|nr:hypothetical protein [Chloroflexota bacterium]